MRWLVFTAVLLAACQGSRKGRLSEQLETRADVSQREIRLRLMDYLREFSGVVERATAQIVAAADDPEVEQAALLWRANIVPISQNAAFHPDPYAALLDVWALAVQMRSYFEQTRHFKQQQEIAVAAAKELEDAIVRFEEYLPGAPVETRAKIEGWAEKNPIRDRYFTRRSPASDLAQITGDPKLSTLAVVESLDEKMTDLADRMTMLAETLPKQVRAEAALMGAQLTEEMDPEARFKDLNVMAVSLERLSRLDDRMKEMIAGERKTIIAEIETRKESLLKTVDEQRDETFESIAAERKAIFASVDDQRTATLDAIAKERETIFAQVDAQRVATLDTLKSERKEIFAALDAQRADAAADFKRVADEMIEASEERASTLVTHFFWSFFLAGAGLILVFGVVRTISRRLAP